jgi:hypothetical protein
MQEGSQAGQVMAGGTGWFLAGMALAMGLGGGLAAWLAARRRAEEKRGRERRGHRRLGRLAMTENPLKRAQQRRGGALGLKRKT